MPEFNIDYHVQQLDIFQDAMDSIRDARSDGKKINLGHRADWRNAVLTVCFGVAAAFIAIGQNLFFENTYTEFAFWLGALMFLFDGVYIIFYVKRSIDKGSNELSTLMIEEEYTLGLIRNLFRKSIKRKVPVDTNSFNELIGKFKLLSKQKAEDTSRQSEKILIIDDVWTFILVLAFYLIGFAFIPGASSNVWRYLILGILILLVLIISFYNSYKEAKSATKEHLLWSDKIRELND